MPDEITSNVQAPTIPVASIQEAADAIIDIITAERTDAARAAQHRYLQLEQHFARYKETANAAVAEEQARLGDAHKRLSDAQTLLAQYQGVHAHANNPHLAQMITPYTQPNHSHIDRAEYQQALDLYRVAQQEANSAKQRLEEIQSALCSVGIVFSSEDNSLRFEAGWASVLAQLEARDFGVMNAGRLHEVLGQLTHRLQHDRETIERLEQQVKSLNAEKMQLVQKYELELQVTQLEATLLQDAAAASQAENSSTTTATTIISEPLATTNPSTSRSTVFDVSPVATCISPSNLTARPNADIASASLITFPSTNPYAGLFDPSRWHK